MYQTRFILGKEYVAIDPIALEKIELGEKFDKKFLTEHSKKIAFDDVTSIVVCINGLLYQYVIANKKMQGLKAMSLFGAATEDAADTTKRDFISIFRSETEVLDIQAELEQFDCLYEQRIQDLDNNEGVSIELPNKFGQSIGDKIIVGYLIREREGFVPLVKPITLTQHRWAEYQRAIKTEDTLASVIDEFFVER